MQLEWSSRWKCPGGREASTPPRPPQQPRPAATRRCLSMPLGCQKAARAAIPSVACACGAPLCRRRAGGLQAAAQSYASVCPRPAALACWQRRRPFRPAASLEYRGGDSRLDRRCWADWCGGGAGCLARGPTRRHLRISWNTPLPAANTLCRTVRLLAPFSPSPFVPAWLARCAR